MSYRYLGNKTRLAGWITDVISSRLAGGATIADPMCGTASVSRALADGGFTVHAADELLFPTLHARARLLYVGGLSFAPIAASYADALAHLNSLPGVPGFFHREYGADGRPDNGTKPRLYFTGANAARIDAIQARLHAWESEGLSRQAVDLLRHDLVLACNRVANIAGTYGYFRATFSAASLAPLRLVETDPAPADPGHRVRRGRLESIAQEIDADACYLDPPYTKRQYAGNYHIPETLARGDEPEPVGMGGLRDWKPEYSAFCSKRMVRDALHESLKRLEVPLIFMSYSSDGLVPRDELRDLLEEHGRVTLDDLPLARYRSNGRVSPGDVVETLYTIDKG